MNYIRPPLERRGDGRVRVEMFLNQYINDRPFRAIATNISPTGLLLQKLMEPTVPLSRVVSLEFEVPGTGEVVWACAESRYDELDEDFQTSGLTFTGMAGKHERLLREFISAKRLGFRLGRRRRPAF